VKIKKASVPYSNVDGSWLYSHCPSGKYALCWWSQSIALIDRSYRINSILAVSAAKPKKTVLKKIPFNHAEQT